LEANVKEPSINGQSMTSTATIVKDERYAPKTLSTKTDKEDHSKIEMDSKDEELLMDRGIDLLMAQKSLD
jgi:hypothetical protein